MRGGFVEALTKGFPLGLRWLKHERVVHTVAAIGFTVGCTSNPERVAPSVTSIQATPRYATGVMRGVSMMQYPGSTRWLLCLGRIVHVFEFNIEEPTCSEVTLVRGDWEQLVPAVPSYPVGVWMRDSYGDVEGQLDRQFKTFTVSKFTPIPGTGVDPVRRYVDVSSVPSCKTASPTTDYSALATLLRSSEAPASVVVGKLFGSLGAGPADLQWLCDQGYDPAKLSLTEYFEPSP
jgi:hypothetical protein